LDVDLSWLGDTLNAHHHFASSYCLLLTPNGELVAGPPADRISPDEVQKAVSIINGDLLESDFPGLSILKTTLRKDPFWQLAQVYNTNEVYARMHRQRRQQIIMVLLGLFILGFVINRYARNERKLLKASEEQARIGGELAVASRIQQEMLPTVFPSYVYGTLEPAREVGGDVFDFYTRDGKLFFCVGDVSGKGVPAAMLVSMSHALFRMVSKKEESPSRILQALNVELCRGNDSNMFMTYFVACLDLYSGELSYASAGHDRPFVLSNGVSQLPAKSNLPLGVFPNTHFEEQVCKLEPGATLLLYTDGLTEAKNIARQEYGRKGIQAFLESFVSGENQSLDYLVSSLSESAHQFAGEAPQSDDLTILAVRFNPENVIRDSLVLKNDESEVTKLSAFVKEFFQRLQLDKKSASGMRLALEEAVVNVIDYAYPDGVEGTVSVLADTNGVEVRFTLVDTGVPFDPTAMLEPDTTLDAQNRPIGGLGILLSRRLMDSISYTRRNGQNVLSLTKNIL
jgi:sigma-B regulation protein RsbU (phosphoserine phosphatase)